MYKFIIACVLLFAVFKLLKSDDDPSGVNTVCFFGSCVGASFEIQERNYSPGEGTFTITGYRGDEFTSNSFNLEPVQRYEGLSFGLEDATTYRELTARKRLHVFNDQNLKIYQTQFSGKKNQCPAGWVHKHLELVLLIPVDNDVERSLEVFELEFDPNGTPFALEGHFLTPLESYFLYKDKRYEVTLTTHESALSNVGSAQHPVHHFLVTGIPLM